MVDKEQDNDQPAANLAFSLLKEQVAVMREERDYLRSQLEIERSARSEAEQRAASAEAELRLLKQMGGSDPQQQKDKRSSGQTAAAAATATERTVSTEAVAPATAPDGTAPREKVVKKSIYGDTQWWQFWKRWKHLEPWGYDRYRGSRPEK